MDGKAVLYIEQCRYAICYRIMDQFENRLGRNSFFRPIATLLPQILLGPFTALLQTQVEPSFLGRVFSLFPSVIGLFIIGIIGDSVGIPEVFIACGSAIVVIGISALFIPSAWKPEKKKWLCIISSAGCDSNLAAFVQMTGGRPLYLSKALLKAKIASKHSLEKYSGRLSHLFGLAYGRRIFEIQKTYAS